MRELELPHEDQEGIVAQQHLHSSLIGQQRRIPGLTLWEYNPYTFILKQARVESDNIVVGAFTEKQERTVSKFHVNTNSSCMYFQALNFKSAKRKIEKRGGTVKEEA